LASEKPSTRRSLDEDLLVSQTRDMQTVTIREAKARLNALIEAAERGEQVVILRGSKLVAAIVPVSSQDVELAPRLTDVQAERFWSRISEGREAGASRVFDSAEEVVAHLSAPPRGARRKVGVSRSRSRTR
jgi:prevent-host-death family protein